MPPAVLLSDFLAGPGRAELAAAGVPLPASHGPDTVYSELLLKPLFSFAGKGIQFDPTRQQLEAIPAEQRPEYLLQQRMHFVPTIETPHGLTQAEIRILYLWPDGGKPDTGAFVGAPGPRKNDGRGSQQKPGMGRRFGSVFP